MVLLLTVGLLGAGCAREAPREATGVPAVPAATNAQVEDRQAAVYAEVLRRYLATPNENSFPGRAFTNVYVLDRTVPGAGDPMNNGNGGTPIAVPTQERITAAVTGFGAVTFIADKNTVIEDPNGCARVRDGGILITLGPVAGSGDRVEVAVSGFVACLGATWLTYVVVKETGGWRVSGTTGSIAVA